MRFFRRSDAPDEAPIQHFWTWWAAARDRIAASIEAGTAHELVKEISDRVARIDTGLAWELAPGATARHALVVTPEGNPALRPKALGWLASAPPVDATWEYHASRQAGELLTLEAGGLRVDLNEFRAIASWNEDRQRVDVKLWHPALEAAPEGTRIQVAFLFLDALLGEDGVERWVGEIDVLDAPITGRSPSELRDEVDRQAAQATGESWSLSTRTDRRGEEAIVVANVAIKSIDFPYHQHHALVTVPTGSEALAGNAAESDALNAAEDRLTEAMAGASGVYVGRVTERRRRLIHFVCRDPGPAKETAEAWARDERRFQPTVQVRPDPSWGFRDELGL
jgi:Family of unknown function (DUF695)